MAENAAGVQSKAFATERRERLYDSDWSFIIAVRDNCAFPKDTLASNRCRTRTEKRESRIFKKDGNDLFNYRLLSTCAHNNHVPRSICGSALHRI